MAVHAGGCHPDVDEAEQLCKAPSSGVGRSSPTLPASEEKMHYPYRQATP